MEKLKTYKLHWTAEVSGVQIVEAFDDQDAMDQFSSSVHIDDLDDSPMYAELQDMVILSKTKKAKKVK